MAEEGDSAEEVTRRSRSNLAFALRCLPRQRREDMVTFYAFCRQVDDLADEPTAPVPERQAALSHWKEVVAGEASAATPVERGVQDLLERYDIERAHLQEIILGMEMDLLETGFETYQDLELYCYRAASAVGLVSIEIFGCRSEDAKDYAVELGHALQLTNIIRDVREDAGGKGRIYLPAEDLERFGVGPAELNGDQESERFLEMMQFEGERTRERYERAVQRFPEEDRRALQASELMRRIYFTLFRKMEEDGFRVLSRRYRLSLWQKVVLLGASFWTR